MSRLDNLILRSAVVGDNPEDLCEWMHSTTFDKDRLGGEDYTISCKPAMAQAEAGYFEPCLWCAWDKHDIRVKFMETLEFTPCPE